MDNRNSLSAAFSNLSMAGLTTSLDSNADSSRLQALRATLPPLQTQQATEPFTDIPKEVREIIWKYTAQNPHRFRIFARRPCERQHFPSPCFDDQRWAPSMAFVSRESASEAWLYYHVCRAKDSSKLAPHANEDFGYRDVQVNFDVDVFVFQAATLTNIRDIGDNMYNFSASVLRKIRFLEVDFHEKDQLLEHVGVLNIFRLAKELQQVTLAVRIDRISSRSTRNSAMSKDDLCAHLKVRQYLEKLARRVKEKAMADSQEVIEWGSQDDAIPVHVEVFLKIYGMGESPPVMLASLTECLAPEFLRGH